MPLSDSSLSDQEDVVHVSATEHTGVFGMDAAPGTYTYREPVDLDDMLHQEENVTANASLVISDKNTGLISPESPIPSFSDDVPLPTNGYNSVFDKDGESVITVGKFTIPKNSTAAELRRKQEKSPIMRGAAPYLQAIKEGLARERELIHPENTIRKTEPGNPLFASAVIESSKKSVEQIAVEKKRSEEILLRAQSLAEEAGKKRDLKSLRTFQLDLAEAIRDEKPSMVQHILSEYGKEVERQEVVVKAKKENSLFAYTAIGLIIFGVSVLGIGGWYAYSIFGPTQQGAIGTTLPIPTFFFVEKKQELSVDDLTTNALRFFVGDSVARANNIIDSFIQLYPTKTIKDSVTGETQKRILSTEEFFSLSGASMPVQLTHSLGSMSMFGVHIWNGNKGFFVFTVDDGSFDNAFSNMLVWESDMARDILPLFGVTSDIYTLNAKWTDMVIKNRDVRVLKNESGDIVLLYTFYDRKTLIITTSADTMGEIISRVIQAKRK